MIVEWVYPLHPRMLCAKFGWKWLSGSGEEDFWILSMYFHNFVIIFPWKRAGPFIWINPLHPRILCAKFGWNWPSGSGEEDENVKRLQTDRQTDGRTDEQTDDGRQVIRKAHLSFQLRWAKNNLNWTRGMKAKFKNWTCSLFHFRFKVYEQDIYSFFKQRIINLSWFFCLNFTTLWVPWEVKKVTNVH